MPAQNGKLFLVRTYSEDACGHDRQGGAADYHILHNMFHGLPAIRVRVCVWCFGRNAGSLYPVSSHKMTYVAAASRELGLWWLNIESLENRSVCGVGIGPSTTGS